MEHTLFFQYVVSLCAHGCGKLTGGFEAFNVPGSLQEVASQEQEGEDQRHHRNEDPGYDGGRHCDHADDLQQDLANRSAGDMSVHSFHLNTEAD